MLAGVCGLLYLAAFLVLHDPSLTLPSLLLVVSGILASALLVELYQRVVVVDPGFALWGWLLAVAGAGGAAIHGAFDLSNNLHPPAVAYAYPNAVDPRGFLTFGLAGIGTIVISWLLLRGAILQRGVAILGIVSGSAPGGALRRLSRAARSDQPARCRAGVGDGRDPATLEPMGRLAYLAAERTSLSVHGSEAGAGRPLKRGARAAPRRRRARRGWCGFSGVKLPIDGR